MSARTRLVYFIIDPYSDARAPVAALLQTGTPATTHSIDLRT
jgi:hypothetical protein